MILCILHVLGRWGWRAPWRAGRGVKEGGGEQVVARLRGLEGRERAAVQLRRRQCGSEVAARLGGRWPAPWRAGRGVREGGGEQVVARLGGLEGRERAAVPLWKAERREEALGSAVTRRGLGAFAV